MSSFPSVNYWESVEARKTFGYYNPKNKEDEEISVRDIVYERVIKLRKAALTSVGWKDAVEDRDIHKKCTAPFVFLIQKNQSSCTRHYLLFIIIKNPTLPSLGASDVLRQSINSKS